MPLTHHRIKGTRDGATVGRSLRGKCGGGCRGGCGGRLLEIHLCLQICHQGAPEALSGVGVRLRSAHPVAPQRLGARRLQVAHACLGCDSLSGVRAGVRTRDCKR